MAPSVMGNGLWATYGAPSSSAFHSSSDMAAPVPVDSSSAVALDAANEYYAAMGRPTSEASAGNERRHGHRSHAYHERGQMPLMDRDTHTSPAPADKSASNEFSPYQEGRSWKTGCGCRNKRTGNEVSYTTKRDAERHLRGPPHHFDPLECPLGCGFIFPASNRKDSIKRHMQSPRCEQLREEKRAQEGIGMEAVMDMIDYY